MNEQQLAHRFRSAVEIEPPLGFDPDDVIDRAVLRQRHGRRMLASAGAAGVLLVTSVVTATVLSNQRTVDAGSAVDTVLTSSQKPTGAPSKWPGFPGSDEIVQRLQRVVPMVVAEHAPGVKLGANDGWSAGRQRTVSTYYPIGRLSSLQISLWHIRDELDLTSDAQAHNDRILVSDTVLPDGAHLKVFHFKVDIGEQLQAVYYRTNGMIVSVAVTVKWTHPSPLPVNQQELTGLVMDPRLTF